MKDFLYYDLFGSFLEYVPTIAISVYLGYLLNKSLSKNPKIKKYSKIISILVAIAIFGLFVYSFNN